MTRGRAQVRWREGLGHIMGALQTRMKALGFLASAHVFLGTWSPMCRVGCRSTKVEAMRPEQDCIVLRW